MKIKDIALVALGAMGVLVYQRYNEQVMEKMEDAYLTMKEKAEDKLEDMM